MCLTGSASSSVTRPAQAVRYQSRMIFVLYLEILAYLHFYFVSAWVDISKDPQEYHPVESQNEVSPH